MERKNTKSYCRIIKNMLYLGEYKINEGNTKQNRKNVKN